MRSRSLITALVLCGFACGQLGIDVVGAGVFDAGLPTDAGPLAFDLAFMVTNTDRVEFVGRCTGTEAISLVGADTPSATCADGRFSATLSRDVDGSFTVMATQSVVTATARWLRDTQIPVVTNVDAEEATTSRIVPLSFEATDNDEVQAFCFDWRGADPAIDDPCFVPVDAPSVGGTPGSTVALDSVPFSIGFSSGTYPLRVFVRDRAGNRSAVGLAEIRYDASTPPRLSRLIATNALAVTEPPTHAELQVAEAGQVYVRWNVTADALPLAPAELFTTIDEDTMVPVPIIGECAATDLRNTCAIIEAPSSSYFRVRVSSTDAAGQVSTSISPPLNSAMRVMSGTTEPSVGAGAVTANIQPLNPSGSSVTVGAGAMVVVDDGTIFLREASGDIIAISPVTALIERVLRMTGESSGDGGPVAEATSHEVHRITTDGRGALLVWDHDRIRRIDLSDPERRIETILGGGEERGDDVPPLMFQITPPNASTAGRLVFSASTNGDIYFTADAYTLTSGLEHFDASEGFVRSLRIQGDWRDGLRFEDCGQAGHMILYDGEGEATEAIAVARTERGSICPPAGLDPGWADLIRFDLRSGEALSIVEDLTTNGPYFPRTGAHVMDGLDGSPLFLSEGDRLGRYDAESDSLLPLAGTNTLGGPCVDETLAPECPMRLFDATTGRDGSLYLLDHGQIRTVDEEGRLLTLYGRSVGALDDSMNALDFRFFDVHHVQSQGDVITMVDTGASRMFELAPGVPVRHLAGTGMSGSTDVALPAEEQPIWTNSSGAFWSGFHRIGDDIYYALYRRVARLRGGTWVTLFGEGSTPYFELTGPAPAADVDFTVDPSAYPPRVIGDNGTELLIAVYSYDRVAQTPVESRLLTYDIAGDTVAPFAGTSGIDNRFCADGTALDACPVPASLHLEPGAWSSSRGGWLLGRAGERRLLLLVEGQPMQTVASFPRDFLSFAFDESSSNLIAACMEGGSLMTMNHVTLETQDLELGAETVRCKGPLHIDGGVLTFAFEQNGLQGIAQVVLPE